MSQVTEKAKQLAQAAQEIADQSAKMDDLHDQFNSAVQEYKDMLAAQVGPEKASQVADANVPTMKGEQQ